MAITNTPDGEARVREIYGDQAAVVPYIMPGLRPGQVLCAPIFRARPGPNTIGMVLLKHGFFSFGATAREAYERMIELVSRAEAYLEQHGAWSMPAFARGRARSRCAFGAGEPASARSRDAAGAPDDRSFT